MNNQYNIEIGNTISDDFLNGGSMNGFPFNIVGKLNLREELVGNQADFNTGASDVSQVYEVVENANVTEGAMEVNLPNQSSISGDAVLTTNYEDDYTVRGDKFHRSEVLEITGASTFYFLLDMSQVPVDNHVFVLPFAIQSKSEDVDVYLYRDTSFTANTATEVPFYNCNENVSDDYDFVITTGDLADFNNTTEGILIRHYVAFANAQGNVVDSGAGGSSDPLILNTSYNYLIKFVTAGTTRIAYDADLFQF